MTARAQDSVQVVAAVCGVPAHKATDIRPSREDANLEFEYWQLHEFFIYFVHCEIKENV